MKLYFVSLFSGIGGFDLAAQWAGLKFDGYFYSEIDKHAIKVFERRFPGYAPLGDIREIKWENIIEGMSREGPSSFIVSGGFPCQPFSMAGRQEGVNDPRDLWPECARMLRELKPAAALFENVGQLLTHDNGARFSSILKDISAAGYDARWQIISAADVGAHHKRERLWILVKPKGELP
jgi:DNA (cytosine-5)-methyltransferase 1